MPGLSPAGGGIRLRLVMGGYRRYERLHHDGVAQPGALPDGLTQTPPGHAWLVRFAIGAILFLLLFLPSCRWLLTLGALLAAAFVAGIAWLGHAGAGDDAERPFMLAADALHLCAASVWPVGLVPFALLLRRQLKSSSPESACVSVRRFSGVSLFIVALLAATGFVNGWFLVGSLRALVRSAYGRLLVVKVALFAGAVILGACNLCLHAPRIETSTQALPRHSAQGLD